MIAREDHAVSPTAAPDALGDGLFEMQDPAGLPQLGSAEEFAAILDGMVAAHAPRVFAVVQEYGDRANGRIAVWGIAFDDRAEVVGVNGGSMMSLSAPQDALCCFAWGRHLTPRLVWVNPDAAASTEDSEVP